MQRFGFFELVRPVQERFVHSARSQAAPLPLLVASPPPPYSALRWGGGALLCVVAFFWLLGVGYGELDSSFALQPKWVAFVLAALLALAVGLAFKARGSLSREERLPYPATVFLFPIGVIDARTKTLEVYGWDEFSGLELKGSKATLRFGGSTFTFPLSAPDQGRELEQRINDLRASIAAGLQERDLVLLDPLRDSGFKSPFSPLESMRPPGKRRVPYAMIGGVVAGAVVGYGAYATRNTLSGRLLYNTAVERDTVEAYRAYLARGGSRPEVAELLLPRAELRVAVRANTVDAVDQYYASHKDSKIAAEIEAALRAALLKELEEVKQKQSITAIREFESRRKPHLARVPELAHVKHAYLQGVLDRFRAQSKAGMPLLDLARRLILYADKHGPRVAIRYRQRESKTLEKNERLLMDSAYFGGVKTLPRRHLVGDPVRKAEQKAGQELAAALQKAFPPDLIRFEPGPPVPDGNDEAPKFEEPTLLVSYRLEISGAFVTKTPRAIFTGVGFIGQAAQTIPDKGEPYEFKNSQWHAPERRRIEAGEIPVESVYPEVLAKAFERFNAKYAEPWLGTEQ